MPIFFKSAQSCAAAWCRSVVHTSTAIRLRIFAGVQLSVSNASPKSLSIISFHTLSQSMLEPIKPCRQITSTALASPFQFTGVGGIGTGRSAGWYLNWGTNACAAMLFFIWAPRSMCSFTFCWWSKPTTASITCTFTLASTALGASFQVKSLSELTRENASPPLFGSLFKPRTSF